MEIRRNQLEKFLYVFNYKIHQLNSDISPREYQINSLLQQFSKVYFSPSLHLEFPLNVSDGK